MGTRRPVEQLILALCPTSRGFGFVVLEGRNRTIDWGAKDARGDKNRVVLAKARELMRWYRPHLLVLENTDAPHCRRTDRIRNLHRQLCELASEQNISISQFCRSEIRATFAHRKASTKFEIAHAISQELPDLEPWLPPPRKIWMSEDPRLSIFGAASLAITFYDALQRGAAS
jgi:hypothetical protein